MFAIGKMHALSVSLKSTSYLLKKQIKQFDITISDSWVELHYDQTSKVGVEIVAESSSTDPAVFYTGSMEKLLIDAQRESATPSRPNSQQSSHRSRLVGSKYSKRYLKQLFSVSVPKWSSGNNCKISLLLYLSVLSGAWM